MKKKIDGCYTKMLRMKYNINWEEMISNKELYGELPFVSSKIKTTSNETTWSLSTESRRKTLSSGNLGGEEEIHF